MSGRISRQLTVLVVTLLLVPAGYVALAPGGSASAQSVNEFSVTQGGQCTTVSPIGDGSQSVEEYYDYRPTNEGEYASHGTTDVQQTATSNLYFYSGTDGVSLVMLHDRLDDDDGGGTITFDVSGGPAGAESNWAVKDDSYGNSTDDDFEHGSSSTHVEWVWAPNRTDGAALTGVGDTDETITIAPGFNEESDRWDSWPYTGEEDRIETWRVLNSDGNGVMELDLSQDVEISAGACPSDVTSTTTSTTTETTTSTTPTTSTTTETTTEETTTQTTETPTDTTTTQTTTEETTTSLIPTISTTTQTTTDTTTTETPTDTTTTQTTTEETTSEGTTTEETTDEGGDGGDGGDGDSGDGGNDRNAGGGGGGGDVSQDGGLGVRDVSVGGENATVGTPLEITITVSNTDVVTHTREFVLRVDGEEVDSERATVDSGERSTLTFDYTFESAGRHEISVGAQRTTVDVAGGTTATATATTGGPGTTTAGNATAAATDGEEQPLETTGAPVEENQNGSVPPVPSTGMPTSQMVLLGVVAVLGSIAVGTWVLGRD